MALFGGTQLTASGHSDRRGLRPLKTLLVANSGGHLAELFRLRPRLGKGLGSTAWITLDHPQARSLLAGEEAYFLRDAPSRDLRAALRNGLRVLPLLRRLKPSWVISSGAALAVSVLPLALAHGARCSYIESSVRMRGPSVSGRILGLIPGIETYTQYPSWASGRWHDVGSLLDAWEARPSVSKPISRVVVTLGTSAWPFPRLIERLSKILPKDVEVLWQTGVTAAGDNKGRIAPAMTDQDLAGEIGSSDLVIAHAGIGSAITAFEAGRMPLLVPRRRRFGEAIDDHQVETARHLAARDLCVFCEVEDLTPAHFALAASRSIGPRQVMPDLKMFARAVR